MPHHDTPPSPPYRSLLKDLHERGLLTSFAWHFADTVARLAPGGADAAPASLVLAAALVAHNTLTRKNVCFSLAAEVTLGDLVPAELDDDEELARILGTPLPPDLRNELRAEACAFAVAQGGAGDDVATYKPLVIEEDRLYLHRYWVYENLCAQQLLARASAAVVSAPDEEDLRSLTRLPLDAEQVAAVRKAVAHRLCVISGGPGTGKTTIVSVVLAALLRGNPGLNIRLCAPTGKAQARLKEALQAEIQHNLVLGDNDVLKQALATLEAATLHRLLRYNPGTGGFAFDADNRLSADVLVVDEVSMVALPLMVKLLRAAPDGCRIILLGDKDQLAAVEIGSALADLCEVWTEAESPVARLAHSHRFDPERGIGRIKEAVNAAAPDAWKILHTGDETLKQAPAPATYDACEQALRRHLEGHPFRRYLEAQTPGEAFALFEGFRILCATHGGPCGVDAANAVLQKLLGVKPYGHGYPVMVTVNDYAHRLFNGDIGLCLRDAATDAVSVWFPDFEESGQFRSLRVSELPQHVAVFAMTVHKAQGSGFGEVLLILPKRESPLLTRELLYTGITRAKRKCIVWADRAIFEGAVARPTRRMSGLREKLRRT